jgi:hypothetical protein
MNQFYNCIRQAVATAVVGVIHTLVPGNTGD